MAPTHETFHITPNARRSPSPVHSPVLTIIEENSRPHSNKFMEILKPHTPGKVIELVKPHTPNKVIEIVKPIHIQSGPAPDVVVVKKLEHQTFPHLIIEKSHHEHIERPHSVHVNRIAPVGHDHDEHNPHHHHIYEVNKNNEKDREKEIDDIVEVYRKSRCCHTVKIRLN